MAFRSLFFAIKLVSCTGSIVIYLLHNQGSDHRRVGLIRPAGEEDKIVKIGYNKK
jgi:hypothetical protein